MYILCFKNSLAYLPTLVLCIITAKVSRLTLFAISNERIALQVLPVYLQPLLRSSCRSLLRSSCRPHPLHYLQFLRLIFFSTYLPAIVLTYIKLLFQCKERGKVSLFNFYFYWPHLFSLNIDITICYYYFKLHLFYYSFSIAVVNSFGFTMVSTLESFFYQKGKINSLLSTNVFLNFFIHNYFKINLTVEQNSKYKIFDYNKLLLSIVKVKTN